MNFANMLLLAALGCSTLLEAHALLASFPSMASHIPMKQQQMDVSSPSKKLAPTFLLRPQDPVKEMDQWWSWNNRKTGIDPQWKAHVGTWKHYNVTSLEEPGLYIAPKPWTSGRLRKCLRRKTDDDSEFELWSVFEEGAEGDFARGGVHPRQNDPHKELKYTFKRAPWRITRLAGFFPEKYPPKWPEEADVLRVCIVSEGEAVFSGVPFIPSRSEARKARDEGANQWLHPMTYELWLSENAGTGIAETVKLGVFIEYDSISGKLKQLFRMQEHALLDPQDITGPRMCVPRFAASQAVARTLDPSAPVNFPLLEQAIAPLQKLSRAHLTSSTAQALHRGEPVSHVLSASLWRGDARVRHFPKGALGGEEEWQAVCEGADYFSPAEGDVRYLDMRFEDGVYVRLPADLELFEAELCLEIGALRSREGGGGMHRLLVLGDRSKGGFHTLSHEVYVPVSTESKHAVEQN